MAKIVKKHTVRQFRDKIPAATCTAWKREISKRCSRGKRGKTQRAEIILALANENGVDVRTITNAMDPMIRLGTPKIVEGINKYFEL